MNKLLRLFIDWIPISAGADKPEFVLLHPDLGIQNVLVSKEGRLCGLIDWHGVAASAANSQVILPD
jgi:aminoglycoside phosphotransferase (APT) family kinase protein